MIPNGTTLCKVCEENYDINNGLINMSTYVKKKHRTKISCSIGEFHMLHYQPILNKYSYHGMLMCLLGKHQCNDLRRQALLADNNYVMT